MNLFNGASSSVFPEKMNVKTSARYVGISTREFQAGVVSGRWPRGSDLNATMFWSRTELDAAKAQLRRPSVSNRE